MDEGSPALTPHPDRAGPDAGDVPLRIEAERLTALHERLLPTLLGGSVFALLVVSVLPPAVPATLAQVWLLARLLTALLRWREARTFFRAPPRQADGVRHWQRRVCGLMMVDALLWGLMAPLFMPGLDATARGLLIAAIVGVAASGCFSLSMHRTAALLFLVCDLAPALATLAWQGNHLTLATAAGLLVFAAVLMQGCLQAHQAFTELQRLRFEHAGIAEARHRALLLAQHSDATKTRFLASVSHELRTPLNGILGMTQMLADEPLSPGQQRHLGLLRQSAEHLIRIISDLLDLSRLEFQRLTLHPRAVPLRDMVAEVTDLLQPLAAERGLGFSVRFAPGLPGRVMLDDGRVRQVLHNLLGNALKFTAQGQVEVRVHADPGQIHIEVEDTGSGIRAEDQQRIFEAFDQGSQQQPGGSGLGLTIARQLARAMGGDVRCQSCPGVGSRFTLSVARVDAQAPEARPAEAPAATRLPPAARVLVAEDNEVNAMMLQAMLDSLGVQAEVCPHGAAALEVLEQAEPGHFHAVLMDCQMPVMDGWTATRVWREVEATRPGNARLPILALTASAIAGEREHCLAAGMDDYLSKPFTREALLSLLARHLAAPSGPAPALPA